MYSGPGTPLVLNLKNWTKLGHFQELFGTPKPQTIIGVFGGLKAAPMVVQELGPPLRLITRLFNFSLETVNTKKTLLTEPRAMSLAQAS